MEILVKIVCVGCLLYLFGGILVGFLGIINGYSEMAANEGAQKIRKRIRRPHYLPISVIVYARNDENTIVECVNSIIKQNHRKQEIVIVDDGSTDETSKLLINQYKLVAVKRPLKGNVNSGFVKEVYETIVNGMKISLLRKEHRGRADAMNAGISASEFPLFLSVDGMVTMPADALSIMMQPMLEDEKNIVSCGNVEFAGYYGDSQSGDDKIKEKSLIANLHRALYERCRLIVNGGKGRFKGRILVQDNFCLFKKKLVEDAGGYDKSSTGADSELISRVARMCNDMGLQFEVAFEDGAVATSYEKLYYGSTTVKHKRRQASIGICLKSCSSFLGLRDYKGGSRLFVYKIFFSMGPILDTVAAAAFLTATFMGVLSAKLFIIGWVTYGVIYGLLSGASLLERATVSAQDLTAKAVVTSMFYGMIDNMLLRFLRNILMFTTNTAM